MPCQCLTKAAVVTFATLLPTYLSAQTADEVKSDVLSALSTPLPITVIGPLLTRDVTVTEEGDGFRATLQDSTLMGLFPFGDVSMKLLPLDENTYQVSDLQFPTNIDIPGLASITLDGMALDGTWSAKDRSYSTLQAELTGLQMQPEQGGNSSLTLGRLAFDVQKEPDETDTESRFDITLADVSAIGFSEEDVSIGEVQALLSANGEKPVDLYSLLREVMMASMRNDSAGLQLLGESLLGNTYGTVALDLKASDLNITDTTSAGERYLSAAGLQASLGMQNVEPRDWGAAELIVRLDQVTQEKLMDVNSFKVEDATIRLGGTELPVADMLAAINTLSAPDDYQPIRVSDLLDGFLEFGGLEFSTQGKALTVQGRDWILKGDEWVEEDVFETSFDSWGMQVSLADFNKNAGSVTSLFSLENGSFIPGPEFPEEDMIHINALFPQQLRYGGRVSNLNEAFLKQLFRDVEIENADIPAEIALPLMLYLSASTLDISIENNFYKTALFNVEQEADYKVYPAKFLSLAPFEGTANVSMTGFEDLLGYINVVRENMADAGPDGAEIGILKSVLIVLRNLGAQADDGKITWTIEKDDVDNSSVTVNGTTLYYPDVNQIMPFFALGMMF